MNNLRISGTTKKIASNTAYQLIGKVVSMSITLLATLIITRMYGLTGYGEFNIMQTFPALFFVIVDFGINAIATRELSENWGKAEKYLGNIIIMRFLISLFLILLASASMFLFPYSQHLKLGIYLSLFLILTQAFYSTTNIIFQVKLRYDLSTIGYIAGSVVVLFLVLLFSYLNIDIIWVNFSYVIGGLVTFLINLAFIKRLGLNFALKIDKHLWKYLLIQSLPLGLMFVFSQINFKADALMLSALKLPESLGFNNTEAVAIYGLPYKIFEVSLVIPTFFMNAVFPVFVRHLAESKEKFMATFKKVTSMLFFVGILASIVGILLAPFVIQILGGAEFAESILVLQLLIGGVFIFYITQPIAWLIVTLGKQKYLPFIYLISAIFNVSLNLILIPRYSYIASSMLTWSSELIILILLIFFARKSWKEKYAQ